jgi:3-deoxy-manno-octulosonate cytidylyltransferase (CMP-KDO synthetase)
LRILCVIPSRISSTRMPRKALLPIQGKPMVQWVYQNAQRCDVIEKVVVATDSEEIAEIIHRIGGHVMLTHPDIETGSDRVAVVAAEHPEADVVINLQGDEPFIQPSMLKQLVMPYLNGESPDMTTLARPLDMTVAYSSPSAVKVIVDRQGNALYFSRAPIPYFRTEYSSAPVYNHIGLYAFKRDFLLHYTQLPPTPLEKIEALEQLRALENGFKIRVCLTPHKTLEINTPEEYAEAQDFIYTESL